MGQTDMLDMYSDRYIRHCVPHLIEAVPEYQGTLMLLNKKLDIAMMYGLYTDPASYEAGQKIATACWDDYMVKDGKVKVKEVETGVDEEGNAVFGRGGFASVYWLLPEFL